jgi:FkbM family methyltransferase
MIWPKADTTIGRSLGLYGEFAESENRLMMRYVKPGDILVDVGANLGTTVLPLAKAVGTSGHVLAFEPQPLMAQCLQTTLSMNECFNVQVISGALADQTGWARIMAAGIARGGNYGDIALGTKGLRVPVWRLDEFELAACELVKIDVEGSEWLVIQGAREQLLRHRPVLYVEAKPGPDTVSYLDWLMNNGWRCFWHYAFFYCEDNFRGNATNVFRGSGDENVLAVYGDRVLPTDLPEIRTPDEECLQVYAAFYQRRGIPMP